MKTKTQRDYEERILRVLVHIQTHLDHAMDLNELASKAHFSPYHFHRVFRGMVGEPVKEHVRRLRLERAAYRLKATKEPITQVALAAGYETHEAFTRAFKTMFGDSPSSFRRAHKPVPEPSVPSGVHYSPEGGAGAFEFEAVKAKENGVKVRTETIAPMRVAFVRHVGPYDQVGTTWQKLMTWAGRNGLLGPNMKAIGIPHDDPEITSPEKLRYDACLVIRREIEPQGDIGVQTIEGGEYAVGTHRGPYEKLNDTYAMLMGQWMPANDREPGQGPCFEVYWNNPQTTRPEDLWTEIYVPLKRKAVSTA